MAIVKAGIEFYSLDVRGKFGFGRGYGGSEYGKARYGKSNRLSGIYQRKLYGTGVQESGAKRAGRWSISRMKHYSSVQQGLGAQGAWWDVFRAGKVQYDLLTTEQKLRLSKEARKQRMSGYNLHMSRWLQSKRG